MVGAEAMSEFKFACPVCGQHITADSSTSGGQIECPTCFQKIVVPQAPDVRRHQVHPLGCPGSQAPPRLARCRALPGPDAALVPPHLDSGPHCAARRARCRRRGGVPFPGPAPQAALRRLAPAQTNPVVAQPATPAPPNPTHPVPTNFSWTLELTNAVIPDTPVAGEIHGSGFAYEKAVLHGGLLLFGQGTAPAWDLGFGVDLVARQSEELSGKTVEIAPDQTNAPRVGWRWKNDQQQPATQIISNGYLLKVTFGQATNGLPARQNLHLPARCGQELRGGNLRCRNQKTPAAQDDPASSRPSRKADLLAQPLRLRAGPQLPELLATSP